MNQKRVPLVIQHTDSKATTSQKRFKNISQNNKLTEVDNGRQSDNIIILTT